MLLLNQSNFNKSNSINPHNVIIFQLLISNFSQGSVRRSILLHSIIVQNLHVDQMDANKDLEFLQALCWHPIWSTCKFRTTMVWSYDWSPDTCLVSIYSSIIYPLLMEDVLPLESGSYGLDNLATEEPMTKDINQGHDYMYCTISVYLINLDKIHLHILNICQS